MCVRSVDLTFQSNPCDCDGFFQREIEKLLDEQRKITTLKMQINALIMLASTMPNNATGFNELLNQIASKLGGIALAPSAALEINQTRSDAQRLLQGD